MVTKCCICGKSFVGYGSNAEPVKRGKCCPSCDMSVVIPVRLLKEVMGNGKK